jgi:hypothetical protein
MEITAVAYDAPESLASLALRQERKADDATNLSARTYDTVSISPEARALAQAQPGDQAEGESSTSKEGTPHDRDAPTTNSVGTGMAKGGDSKSDTSTVEQIQKQIREAEQKLSQALDELNQAAADNGHAPQATENEPAPPRHAEKDSTSAREEQEASPEQAFQASTPHMPTQGPAENGNVKMLQMKIASINAELMELRQALQEAIKSEGAA